MATFSPKQQLTRMMDEFTCATRGLVEVTNRDFYENPNENAIYGLLYGKPSQRLITLLSIDREILILFTSFKSQQARTVKAIKTLINISGGRLEPAVVIVVHPDLKGNSKLKSWGRENGISILPVYYSNDGFPRVSEEFENLLCKELFSYDPFDITGPVSDDNHFYGRRAEALDIARQLQIGQIKATLGIRKIGKTSIINRIVDTCNKYYECMIVVIDCSKDEIWSLNSSELLYSISCSINKIRENNDKYTILLPTSSIKDIKESAKALTDEIGLCNYPIILVFDEIDYITPGSPTGKHWITEFNPFWRNLRGIYQECMRTKKPFSMLLSGVSSKWFRVESINGIENSALSLVPEEYLSPLPRGATIAMIKTLSRVAGLQFDETSAEQIAATCCDSPYWVRKACSYIHKRIDIQIRPMKPNIELIKNYLEDFVNSEGGIIAQIAIQHLFRVFPELKQFCKCCFLNKYSEVPKSYISILIKYGLIREGLKGFELSGMMIKEGLSLIFDEKNEKDSEEQMITNNNFEKSSIEEWADELAIVNRRRNILEKKLRSIVLNFLRYDSLQDKSKTNPHDRIIKKVDERRRKQIERLGPDELIENFFGLN